MLSFEQAFANVRDALRASAPRLSVETVTLNEAHGRILAEDLLEDVLQPVMTERRMQYLVPGLFQQASVAQYVSSNAENARFTASCRLRLLQILPSYKARFRRSGPWDMGGPSWIVEPVDCKVD